MICFELVAKVNCGIPGKRQQFAVEGENYKDLTSLILGYCTPEFLGEKNTRLELVMWSFQPNKAVILRTWRAEMNDENGMFNPHWVLV